MILRQGMIGDAVTALQLALLSAGCDPGGADGRFGPATEDAVQKFQASKNLGADGIVGPVTRKALGLPDEVAAPAAALADITGEVTAAMVSRMFPGTPMGNIVNHLPPVLSALSAAGLGDKDMVLMGLATIRAETASFRPVKEGISRWNTSRGGEPFDLYDDRRNLGNRGSPDGASFAGRGFVQLTGRANYAMFGPVVGADLVTNPEQACLPAVAARLLAAFLKVKEFSIRDALADGDLAEARKLVNGGRHGLTEFTDAFQRGTTLIPAV